MANAYSRRGFAPLRPIRNMLPSPGGIDISPVVLILIIILIKSIIIHYIYPVVF